MDRVGTFLFERLIAVDAEKIATRLSNEGKESDKREEYEDKKRRILIITR